MSALLAIIILLPTIASGTENDELINRIDMLERSVNNMQKSIANLVINQKGDGGNQDMSKNFKDLSEEIKNLQSDIERLELKMKKYSNQYDKFEHSINNKVNELIKDSRKIETSTQSKDNYIITNIAKEIESNNLLEHDENPKSNKDKAASEYQKAYVLLKQDEENHSKALEAFMQFVEKFQDSPLRGNAYYWIGSIHSEQKNYNKAAIDFLNGYKANPKSGRAIDNLLGLSSSLIKLNKNKEACSAINKLYNEFPNMNVTNKRHADEMFQNASCTNND